MKKILICCVTITLLLCLFSCDVSQNSSHSHSFHSSWEYDGNAHWHKCECSEKSEYASHEFGDWYSSFQNTEMNLIERICTVCGYREEKEVPIHQHSYFENFDAQFHWSECACRNITSKEAHTFDWITTKQATNIENGERKQICSKCGYVNATEIINRILSDYESAVQLIKSHKANYLSYSFVFGGENYRVDSFSTNEGTFYWFENHNKNRAAGEYLIAFYDFSTQKEYIIQSPYNEKAEALSIFVGNDIIWLDKLISWSNFEANGDKIIVSTTGVSIPAEMFFEETDKKLSKIIFRIVEGDETGEITFSILKVADKVPFDSPLIGFDKEYSEPRYIETRIQQMSPTYEEGAIGYFLPIDVNNPNLKIGDVIAYYSNDPDFGGWRYFPLTARIVEIRTNEQKEIVSVITQNDNQETVNAYPCYLEDIIGILSKVFPKEY